jgi:hypothetical protein
LPEPRRAPRRRDSGASALPDPDTTTETPDDAHAEAQLNVRIPTELRERALNAFYGTDVAVVWKGYVREALDQFTRDLEQKYNGGQPFPPRPVDHTKLPPGRRAGISPRKVT